MKGISFQDIWKESCYLKVNEKIIMIPGKVPIGTDDESWLNQVTCATNLLLYD